MKRRLCCLHVCFSFIAMQIRLNFSCFSGMFIFSWLKFPLVAWNFFVLKIISKSWAVPLVAKLTYVGINWKHNTLKHKGEVSTVTFTQYNGASFWMTQQYSLKIKIRKNGWCREHSEKKTSPNLNLQKEGYNRHFKRLLLLIKTRLFETFLHYIFCNNSCPVVPNVFFFYKLRMFIRTYLNLIGLWMMFDKVCSIASCW